MRIHPHGSAEFVALHGRMHPALLALTHSTNMTDELTCWVYRSCRRDEMYLYLAGKDVFDPVPAALLKAMGRLELVLELTLTPERRLAREDVNLVLANLRGQGFHLQMPPRLTPDLYRGE